MTTSAGPDLQRVELAEEAIRLARTLQGLLPGDGETTGLLALTLLTHARRHARVGPDRALIPLTAQDRSLWAAAAAAYRAAARLTTSLAERRYLEARAAAM